jgi:thioredoxin-dependent peroxiredoxin
MIAVGNKAPPFELPAAAGPVSLSDFGGGYLVLYFYPRDLTPGCTAEAIAFRDAGAELARRKARVVGVSRDSVASHERFAAKHGLDFPLLSDPAGDVIRAYGAWGEKVLYGKRSEGVLRTTVIIDPDGKVARVFEKVRVAGHAETVLAALDELRRAA